MDYFMQIYKIRIWKQKIKKRNCIDKPEEINLPPEVKSLTEQKQGKELLNISLILLDNNKLEYIILLKILIWGLKKRPSLSIKKTHLK